MTAEFLLQATITSMIASNSFDSKTILDGIRRWVEIDRAFGPGIYDMKGGAYLAYYAFRQLCAGTERPLLGVTQIYVSDEGRAPPRSASISWTHPPAAAPMATSPRRIRQRSTVSALMARARTPTMSRSTSRRSSRGRGCCIGCIRP